MENAPMIKARLSEIQLAETSLDLEKSNRIPDLTIAGGMKDVDGEDDTIYLVGLSIPIPLFDRNQAGVARAAAELEQQAAALSAEKNRILKDLKIAYQTLKTAHRQVNTIKTDILPAAQRVLDAVKEGYQEGAFSFLDMLEAQSTLYESHESYVQSLGQYHIAVIDLEKVLGRNLSSFNSSDRAMAQ
jgi:cobalt-zinc-cadmium efflux system outer membrane protein